MRVTGKTSKGEPVSLEAEMFLVAVGRMPYTEGLGLEGTKIKVEKGFIQVDEFQQTAEKGVYAIGDVVPTPLLAHLCFERRHRRGRAPRRKEGRASDQSATGAQLHLLRSGSRFSWFD